MQTLSTNDHRKLRWHSILRSLQNNGFHQSSPQTRTNSTDRLCWRNDILPWINRPRNHGRRCLKYHWIHRYKLTCQFNAILERPCLYNMKAVPSTYHQCLKFPIRNESRPYEEFKRAWEPAIWPASKTSNPHQFIFLTKAEYRAYKMLLKTNVHICVQELKTTRPHKQREKQLNYVKAYPSRRVRRHLELKPSRLYLTIKVAKNQKPKLTLSRKSKT